MALSDTDTICTGVELMSTVIRDGSVPKYAPVIVSTSPALACPGSKDTKTGASEGSAVSVPTVSSWLHAADNIAQHDRIMNILLDFINYFILGFMFMYCQFPALV